MLAATFNVAFFFVVGVVYGLSLELIVVGTVVRLFLRSAAPVGYIRAMKIVAYVLATTAALISFAYFSEYYSAWRHGNRYETYSLLRSRVAGPVTDLAHWVHPAFPKLPWAPYWWAYYTTIITVLGVESLWIPAVRRRPVLILCATVPALIASRLEQLVSVFTLLAH